MTGMLKPGEVVGNRYRVEKKIGGGGQTEIFRARDTIAGDLVAIRVLRTNPQDENARERMMREAWAITQLRSPAVVAVLDQCWSQAGYFCLINELLAGEDLETALSEDRNLSFADRLTLLKRLGPVADAVTTAHHRNMLHRDIKPDNIFLLSGEDFDPDVRLLDFGFVKMLGLPALTSTGNVAGSPRYLSPEAWELGTILTPASDIYSLSAVFYCVLSGSHAFTSLDILELMRNIKASAFAPLSEVSPYCGAACDDWLKQGMARNPADRFLTAKACYRALMHAVDYDQRKALK